MTNRSGRQTAAKLPRFVRRAELQLIVPLADTTIYDMECKGGGAVSPTLTCLH